MVQIYHFYSGKANNLMIVCGVLKSFSTFILLCKMKLGCTSKILKTYFGISLGLHYLCGDEAKVSSRHFGKLEALCLSC